MVSSLGDVRSVPCVFILDWCFFHRLLSLGYCFVHPFSSKQPPSSQGPHDINHNTQQDEAKTVKIVLSSFSSSILFTHRAIVIDPCLCMLKSFPWLSKTVMRQEFMVNIALNGQAFKTHERSRSRERHASSRTVHPNNFMLQPFGYSV